MPARNREAWNDEDIETLHRMAREGEDVTAIARALERTREAVATKARQRKVRIAPK